MGFVGSNPTASARQNINNERIYMPIKTESPSGDEKISLKKDNSPKEPTISNRLNEAFKQGRSITEVAELLQQIHNPILLDFNNVLVNNEQPITPNPDALAPFQELKKVGTVIVLTTATNWEEVQKLLQEFGYWSDDLILINSPSYANLIDMCDEDLFDPETAKLITEYMALAQQHQLFSHPQMEGRDTESEFLWMGSAADKKVAFAFMKPYLIPLIDDLTCATTGNPGILGIQVTPWYAPSDSMFSPWLLAHPENQVKLSDALEVVKNHYKQS